MRIFPTRKSIWTEFKSYSIHPADFYKLTINSQFKCFQVFDLCFDESRSLSWQPRYVSYSQKSLSVLLNTSSLAWQVLKAEETKCSHGEMIFWFLLHLTVDVPFVVLLPCQYKFLIKRMFSSPISVLCSTGSILSGITFHIIRISI